MHNYDNPFDSSEKKSSSEFTDPIVFPTSSSYSKPPAPQIAEVESAEAPDGEPYSGRSDPQAQVGARLVGWLLPFVVFVSVLLVVLYLAPILIVRWHLADADARAQAGYLQRQAELKAEAEAAEKFLQVMDKKAGLVSLGFRKVVQKVTPQVVNVASFREPDAFEVKMMSKHSFIYDPDTKRYYQQSGVGSGVIAKPGYILTNHHVVKKAERLRVTFASGQSVWVEPYDVLSDPETDLAVLPLPKNVGPALRRDYNQTAVFADSSTDVQVGDLVLAVGSPLGLKHTVTQGVVSAKGRMLDLLDKVELLQTDTPINPGNSGGPLFDLMGRVAGINVAIASDTGHNQGIGFAIPSNVARDILATLLEKGEVVRGFIGIEMDDLHPDLAKQLGLMGKGTVLVKRVVPNFPADKAGLKPEDIILSINDKLLPINNALRYFRQRVMEVEVGDEVEVGVLRAGEQFAVQIVVGPRPDPGLLP